MQLTEGHRLGVYEVIAPLAAGGMGEVYRAHFLLSTETEERSAAPLVVVLSWTARLARKAR